MSRGFALWWERRWVWLPAAVFVLVGIGLIAGYELAVAGRLGLQAGALEARRRELEEVTARRRETAALLLRARSTRAAIDELYDKRLGSEAERLTVVMLDVKKLARQAGLSGIDAISYGDEVVEGLPLLKKSITFSAFGEYQQLRAFVNLLELSPSFMSLDEIRVHGGGDRGGGLRMQVRLSTMFLASEAGPTAPVPTAPVEPTPAAPSSPPAPTSAATGGEA